MILSGRDKLLHTAACFLITVVAFLFLLAIRELWKRMLLKNATHTGGAAGDAADDLAVEYDIEATNDGENEAAGTMQYDPRHLIRNNWVFAAIASTLALVIGIAKEIGDMYNFWWLCKAKNEDGTIVGCDASWADFLADVIGVILANIIIFGSLSLWSTYMERKSTSRDYSVARTNSDA